MVHIHNRILLSYKGNTFESVLMRWMKLEPIIQSEVSQKGKQYSILIIYMEFRNMVMMTLYVRQQKRYRCILQRKCFGSLRELNNPK